MTLQIIKVISVTISLLVFGTLAFAASMRVWGPAE